MGRTWAPAILCRWLLFFSFLYLCSWFCGLTFKMMFCFFLIHLMTDILSKFPYISGHMQGASFIRPNARYLPSQISPSTNMHLSTFLTMTPYFWGIKASEPSNYGLLVTERTLTTTCQTIVWEMRGERDVNWPLSKKCNRIRPELGFKPSWSASNL